jgi:8-oxo-dGTP pyrophosphatase MutT (NUDIX family)
MKPGPTKSSGRSISVLAEHDDAEVLVQVGALPIRQEGGRVEVLLVTSRETRRWIIPKGWRMKGRKDHKAAAIEARQEAGVTGRVRKKPVGSYLYWKRRAAHFDLVRVDVYLLEVERKLERWREAGQREACWFDPAQASRLVVEAGLAAIIAGLSQHDDKHEDRRHGK